MIELWGLLGRDLPDRETLCRLLKREWVLAWVDRHRSMRSDRLARQSLGGLYLLQLSGADGLLRYAENGKPYFEDSSVTFSITHTEDGVFCAVSFPAPGEEAVPLGIDAEPVGRFLTMRICPFVDRWFTATEQELYFSDPSAGMFAEIWTGKEALVKMQGEGLSHLAETDSILLPSLLGVSLHRFYPEGLCVTLCAPTSALVSKEIYFVGKEAMAAWAPSEKTGESDIHS